MPAALEVPHRRRPSEVVQDASWDASRRTRLLPCRRMTRARLRSLAEQTRERVSAFNSAISFGVGLYLACRKSHRGPRRRMAGTSAGHLERRS